LVEISTEFRLSTRQQKYLYAEPLRASIDEEFDVMDMVVSGATKSAVYEEAFWKSRTPMKTSRREKRWSEWERVFVLMHDVKRIAVRK
jgi:hypothetical protein